MGVWVKLCWNTPKKTWALLYDIDSFFVTWILFYIFWKLIYIAVVLINSLQDWDQKKVDADFVKETRPKQDCLILYVRDKTLLKIQGKI